MQISYWGNFSVPWTTENEIAKALGALGHGVGMCQEGTPGLFPILDGTDLVLWTRTADLARRNSHAEQRAFLIEAKRRGIPTVGIHLDRFWNLGKGAGDKDREAAVWSEPFFRCEHFFSTDGAHDLEWEVAGVNHHWLPPAVSEFECVPGTPRDEYRWEFGFIGTQRHYHGEWPHRAELVERLAFAGAAMWPKPGQHAVRGDDLRDLVASVKVWVGDSCLAPRADGGPMHSYLSDRLPELIGRGAFVLHPHVDGVTDGTVFTDGEHLVTWQLGDWDDLFGKVDYYLAHDDEREAIAKAGAEHVRRNHTYTVRMEQVLELVAPFPPATAGERAFYANSGWQ